MAAGDVSVKMVLPNLNLRSKNAGRAEAVVRGTAVGRVRVGVQPWPKAR